VVVGSATSGAMLDPSRPVPENTTREDVEFDAGDFTASTPTPAPERTPAATVEAQGPGFGAVVTVLAVLGAALVAHRRRS
jgi:PGF-CTERM protein